ncbi:MAG: site-specific integrase [Oscillospiraceae bacterium]|nr:site-specific integrase [Oscillospiraceae bacterium]
MANITTRKNKAGEIISYRIRVARGYDSSGKKLKPYEMTWRPAPHMSNKQIEKELNSVAVTFEQQCKAGLAGNGKQKFADYAGYVMHLKEQNGELRHHTAVRYRELLERVNAGIGHIRICDIRPQHLNAFYEQLGKEGIRKANEKAVLKSGVDLPEMIHAQGFTSIEKFLKDSAKLSAATYRNAVKGQRITAESAGKLASALRLDIKTLFTLETDNRPLSAKTIREHHVLIHMILHQAEQELLIPYNPADKAKPPKLIKSKANYFEQEEVTAILQASEQEPLKWKTLLHLMLVTGGRRGEVLGLTWDCVDFTFHRIYIEKCVYYEAKTGIYIDKPKTESSVRWIKLPDETMQLLQQYHGEYYKPLQESSGSQWQGKGFLFVVDSGNHIGRVMHPDSVTDYCNRFSEKYGLRHINPHAFRHTSASLLYFAGVDSITISAHLGHAKVSTTTDIYSHVISEAQSRVASAMGEIILTTRKPINSMPEHTPKTKTG